jgi:hypothetical protein
LIARASLSHVETDSTSNVASNAATGRRMGRPRRLKRRENRGRSTPSVLANVRADASLACSGLLQGEARFPPPWRRETLLVAPTVQFAVLQLAGDSYEAPLVPLESVHPKLSPDGHLIIDNYALLGCRRAVDDSSIQHSITESMRQIDRPGSYGRRVA